MNRYLALVLICVFTVASCGGTADAGPTGTPAATSEVVYIVVTPTCAVQSAQPCGRRVGPLPYDR